MLPEIGKLPELLFDPELGIGFRKGSKPIADPEEELDPLPLFALDPDVGLDGAPIPNPIPTAVPELVPVADPEPVMEPFAEPLIEPDTEPVAEPV